MSEKQAGVRYCVAHDGVPDPDDNRAFWVWGALPEERLYELAWFYPAESFRAERWELFELDVSLKPCAVTHYQPIAFPDSNWRCDKCGEEAE